MIIPQRLVTQFWRMNSGRGVLFLPGDGKDEPAQREKRSSRAVSLVRRHGANMVMTTSAVHTPRTVEKVCTVRWERAEKISRS